MKHKILFILLILIFSCAVVKSAEPIDTKAIDSAFSSVDNVKENVDKTEKIQTGSIDETLFLDPESLQKTFNNKESNMLNLIFTGEQTFYTGNLFTQHGMCLYKEAMERFTQSNVTVAYKNFQAVIDSPGLNDFYYMFLAYKMADIGFFSLMDEAVAKIENLEIWQKHIDSINKYYRPKYKHTYEEEIFLANIYTSIHYNNLTRESIMDVFRHDKLIRRSDYANYLVSNALFLEKDYARALSTINRAISIDSDNIYYFMYKVRILSELNKYDDALKVVKVLDSYKICAPDSIKDINKLKYFILSKCEKDELKSKYYLACYFYLNHDYPKALKELNIIVNKGKMPIAACLKGDIHFINKNYNQAKECYEKAVLMHKKCFQAHNGLGNIYLIDKDYSNANEQYLKSYKIDKQNIDTIINLCALGYLTSNPEQTKKYSEVAMSVDSNYYKSLYIQSKIRVDKEAAYLNRASVSNPFYADIWFDLTDIAIKENKVDKAESYINSLKLLKENDYKYYYYVSLIDKIKNNNAEASNNFNKAVKLYMTQNNKNHFEIQTTNIREF